jgi:sugar/nucleoside kinase (ribokinase family)
LAWLPTLHPDVVVVLDPGAAFAALPQQVRDAMLEVTDVWSSNAEEAEDVLRAVGEEPPGALAALTAAVAPLLRGDAVAIVRDGPEGCAVHVAGATTDVPGFPQTPVDTNGAGDTHTGALLAEVAAGTPWVEGCRRANAAAAIKVTRRGPESAPTSAEVDAFLADLAG